MTEAHQVRPLTATDLSSMIALEHELFPTEAWSPQSLLAELNHSAALYLGVWVGEDLAGYGGIKGLKEGDLMTLGVAQQYQRRGFGSLLLSELLQRAQTRGMRQIFLEVRASNVAAQALYSQHGFTELAKIPNYYRFPPESAITMVCELGKH